jgi:hypothetical protein
VTGVYPWEGDEGDKRESPWTVEGFGGLHEHKKYCKTSKFGVSLFVTF